MSSTNVHSNKYVCGGYTIFTENEKEPVKIPQEIAGRSPSIEEAKNNGMEIQVNDNVVMKENGVVLRRTTTDGRILSEKKKVKAQSEKTH